MFIKEGGGGGGGEERRCSSRELLLALGWLIAEGTLEKLVSQRVKKLDRTLFTPMPVNSQFPTRPQIDSSSLRKLQWLVGSLRHQNRILLSMQEERTHLLHAVFLASLSYPESSFEQTSAVLKEDCVCMRGLCELLESYLNWKQVEKVFWTWMGSVLDCHLTDPVVVEKAPHTLRGSAKVCHHGNRGLEKMENMLQRLPTRQKGQGRYRAFAEDRGGAEALQAGSDTSSLPHLLPSLSTLHTFPQVYRARLQTIVLVKHSSRPTDGPCGGAETTDELPASQATQLLLQMEALLLQRRDTQRLANRMQMQEVVSRQEDLVLIPP
ncbi:tubulin epsilon and delta complex protein 1 [Xyrichtys novacula]|nr:tubulin epsilon and delta complex protein 1 [Xyrichtys novacula]